MNNIASPYADRPLKRRIFRKNHARTASYITPTISGPVWGSGFADTAGIHPLRFSGILQLLLVELADLLYRSLYG